ncbi:ATP-binding protein [uncultured Piscinibacter sp.]|uniref:ATP-binding protein n=1 Tax=uncultured Piscinibacter sp. TaxID=1131835 RepID=UPI00262A2AAF|nr:ATP-binding protein [uncultured Piscinibacter sp.]
MKILHSLQARVLALALATVSLVWLAAAAFTWWEARNELGELLDGHLAQAAALLIVRQVDDIEETEDDARIDAPTLHRHAPKVAFQIWHEGRLVARSANAPATPMTALRRGFASPEIAGERWRVFAAHGDKRDVQVYVGEQLASRDSILEGLLAGLVGPMLVALPPMALLLWWAVHRGLLPLRRIGVAIAAREPKALQPIRADAAGDRLPSEIAPLVEALNGLFARIAALLESERRFTADAAHELRTPIAAIRAQAQVAQGAGGDDTARAQALAATLAGCDRATRLVEQLLTLARLESAAEGPGETVDLAAVAREVLADLAPAALARSQSLELEAEGAQPVRGSATLLAVLLRNLADNALRYGGDGVRVVVTLAREDGRTVLRVEDSGPGLSDEQRSHLGERFFRVLGTAAPGSGLGWSIVRRIAAVHGAHVDTARSGALGGLAVRVTFSA